MTPEFDFSPAAIHALAMADVARALAEDLGAGDLTAGLIAIDRPARARVLAREAAVLCGTPWAEAAVHALDPTARLTWHVPEGGHCAPDQVVLDIEGRARALLSAERTVLNFLQLLSAVATKTAHYVAAVHGTSTHIVDTRKTLPGLRLAQKYAVRTGGGVNHRIGLFDAVLIKENHIAAAGGIGPVLAHAAHLGHLAAKAKFIEVEVETLAQLQEALKHGAKMVLLDNMDLAAVTQAVQINRAFSAAKGVPPAILEVSGGITNDRLQALAQAGVDRISIGALTKDVKAIDFSMRFEGF